MSANAGFLLMLCCNDERGNFTEKLAALGVVKLGIDVEVITIECGVTGEELSVDINRDPSGVPRFWIGKRLFLHHGHRSHVGNLLWESLRVTADVAAQVVGHVMASRAGRRRYQVTEAVGDLLQRAETGGVRSIDLIRA